MSRNIFLDKKPTRTRQVFSDSRRELDEFFLSKVNPKYFLRVSCGQASIVPCEFLNMAAGSREGELETFFRNFNELLNQVTSSTDHLLLEYLERKLENYMSILLGMICQLEGGKSNDNEPSTENKLMLQLLEELFTLSYGKWEVILQTISEQEVDQSGYYPPKEKTLGRPKFSITKEQLLLLRETGMTRKKYFGFPVDRENSSSSRRESEKTRRFLVENHRKLVEFSSKIRENSSSSRRESQKTRRLLVENQRKLVEFSSRITENSSSSRRESQKTRRVLVGFLSRKIFLDILGMELVSTNKKLNLWYA